MRCQFYMLLCIKKSHAARTQSLTTIVSLLKVASNRGNGLFTSGNTLQELISVIISDCANSHGKQLGNHMKGTTNLHNFE